MGSRYLVEVESNWSEVEESGVGVVECGEGSHVKVEKA